MRTSESWAAVVHPVAHIGADGELERQIKRIQDDARADLKELVKAWREQAMNQYGGLPEFWFVLNNNTDDALAK